MKCVKCGMESNYRERRASGRCRFCGREFAFEPRNDRVTDLMFKLAIEAVSDDGRLVWTDDHLYYDVCRRVRRRRILHRVLRRAIVSLDRPSFEALLSRWIDLHGPPGGRLERRAFADGPADEPRSEAHCFEQLVVCGDEATADVLIVNGFHAAARCPVLSYGGYPRSVYDTLIPRLRESPPARVAVVHNSDWEGCRLAHAIVRDRRWFAGVDLPAVLDAGLRPADARRFRGLFEPATGGVADGTSAISEAEAKWLSTYRLDLAAARPRVLMDVLARVLRGEAERDGTDGDVPWFPWGDGDDDVG